MADSSATTPLALRANVEHNGVLHEHVVIVSAQAQNVPHVPLEEQVTFDDLGNPDDGIVFVSIRYGFADSPDLPKGLTMAAGQHPETHYDPDTASYPAHEVPRAELDRLEEALGRVAAQDKEAYRNGPPDRVETLLDEAFGARRSGWRGRRG